MTSSRSMCAGMRLHWLPRQDFEITLADVLKEDMRELLSRLSGYIHVSRRLHDQLCSPGSQCSGAYPLTAPSHLLPAYVHDLIAHGYRRIVIVDDGSGPDYADIFRGLDALPECTVLSYEVNQGKGHALKFGMAYIAEHFPDDGIVTADSDGQHTSMM